MKNQSLQFERNPFSRVLKFSEESFDTLMNLEDHSFRLLHYLVYRSRRNRLSTLAHTAEDDFEIFFDVEDASKKTNRSSMTIYKAIKDLEENKIIAKSRKSYKYYINPQFLFHGTKRRSKK